MKKQTTPPKKVVVCSYSFILFDILFQLVLERRRASLSVYLRRGSLSCRPLVVAVGQNYLVYYSSCHLKWVRSGRVTDSDRHHAEGEVRAIVDDEV